eukprot:PhM_4_TR17799/c0_g1_i1/m.46644
MIQGLRFPTLSLLQDVHSDGQVRQLKRELESLHGQLAAAKEEVQHWQQQCDRVQRDHLASKKRIDGLQNQISQMQTAKMAVERMSRQRIADLHDDLRDSENAMKTLKAKVTDLEALSRRGDDDTRFQVQRALLMFTRNTIIHVEEKLKKMSYPQSTNVVEIRNYLREREKEFVDGMCVEEAKMAKETIEALEAQLDTVTAQKDVLSTNLRDLRREINDLRAQNLTFKRQHEQHKKSVAACAQLQIVIDPPNKVSEDTSNDAVVPIDKLRQVYKNAVYIKKLRHTLAHFCKMQVTTVASHYIEDIKQAVSNMHKGFVTEVAGLERRLVELQKASRAADAKKDAQIFSLRKELDAAIASKRTSHKESNDAKKELAAKDKKRDALIVEYRLLERRLEFMNEQLEAATANREGRAAEIAQEQSLFNDVVTTLRAVLTKLRKEGLACVSEWKVEGGESTQDLLHLMQTAVDEVIGRLHNELTDVSPLPTITSPTASATAAMPFVSIEVPVPVQRHATIVDISLPDEHAVTTPPARSPMRRATSPAPPMAVPPEMSEAKEAVKDPPPPPPRKIVVHAGVQCALLDGSRPAYIPGSRSNAVVPPSASIAKTFTKAVGTQTFFRPQPAPETKPQPRAVTPPRQRTLSTSFATSLSFPPVGVQDPEYDIVLYRTVFSKAPRPETPPPVTEDQLKAALRSHFGAKGTNPAHLGSFSTRNNSPVVGTAKPSPEMSNTLRPLKRETVISSRGSGAAYHSLEETYRTHHHHLQQKHQSSDRLRGRGVFELPEALPMMGRDGTAPSSPKVLPRHSQGKQGQSSPSSLFGTDSRGSNVVPSVYVVSRAPDVFRVVSPNRSHHDGNQHFSIPSRTVIAHVPHQTRSTSPSRRRDEEEDVSATLVEEAPMVYTMFPPVTYGTKLHRLGDPSEAVTSSNTVQMRAHARNSSTPFQK